jgi:hypothetical protein
MIYGAFNHRHKEKIERKNLLKIYVLAQFGSRDEKLEMIGNFGRER